MFSKSKTKRFQDPVSTGPAVGQYNVKDLSSVTKAVVFEKDTRWKARAAEEGISGYGSMENLSGSSFTFGKCLMPISQSTCMKKPSNKRKSCYVSSSASDIRGRFTFEADVDFQTDKIRDLQAKIIQLESEIVKLKASSGGTTNTNKDFDEIINEKLATELEKQRLEESLRTLKVEESSREEEIKKSLHRTKLSVTKIIHEITDRYNSLERNFIEIHNDYQKRLERASSLLEKTMVVNRKQIDKFEKLERDHDMLVAEHSIKENLITEHEQKLAEYTNNVNLLMDQLQLKDDSCNSLNTQLVDVNKEKEEKEKVFSEEKENILKQIAGLESIHEKELKEIHTELLNAQNLNLEYSQQIESIEFSMTENIREISKKYECLEETFDKAQKYYQKSLERSNSLVQKTIAANKKNNEELESMQKIYTELQHDFGVLSIECESKENMLLEKRQKVDEYENSTKLLVDQLAEKDQKVDEYKKNAKLLVDQLGEKDEKLEEYENNEKLLVGQLVEKDEKISEYETNAQLLEDQLSEKDLKIGEYENNAKLLVDQLNSLESIKVDEEELNKLRMMLTEVENTSDEWRLKYEELQQKVEPFMDQLEQFELEKRSLLNQNSLTQQEMRKLSEKYGEILGHQNNKQKIRHISKLKDENFQLKSEVMKLRSNAQKDKIKISQLESKSDGKRFDSTKSFSHGGKENRDALKSVNS